LEMNDDFAEAMATFKMLEDIKSNMECENPDDVSTCKVFNGEVSYCGIEQTGLGFNCCTLSAGQTNIFDYIKGVYHHYAMEQSLA
ncbi:conjugal transfer protein TraN, partial [Vibrio breoganii]